MNDPFGSLSLDLTSTVDRIAGELRRAVFEGEIEPGTPLRELALATTLGVARSTVREALAILVAEGIATREPHRGVTVTVADPETVHDVCTARCVLEIAGIRRWHEAEPEQRAAVRAALDAYTDAIARGAGYQELNETHLALHVSFVALAGSPRLVAMADSLMSDLKLVLAQIDRAERNAHDQAQTHTALVELLEGGRIDAAVAELDRHIADAERDILAALGATDPAH